MTTPSETITLLYFAALRERLGLDSEQVPLEALKPSPNVASLWRWLEEAHPQLTGWRAHLRLAINHDFVDDPSSPLRPGDEVALIPPVSGGQTKTLADETGRFVLTTAPVSTQRTEALVAKTSAGAIVSFAGNVRDHTQARAVDHLIYETYPEMALKKLVETAAQTAQQWPNLEIAIHHRYGRLELGECAVAISVSSPHRAAAFEACQFVIDTLKQVVPIWKKEISPDGDIWVGMGP